MLAWNSVKKMLTNGSDVKEINRDPGLCASAILLNDIYIVENAKKRSTLNVKYFAVEISEQLQETCKKIEVGSSSDIVTDLGASTMYLNNKQNSTQ